MAKDIKCTCGHSWNKSDSSKKDMYVCHMCGNSNVPKAQVGYKLGKSEDEVRQAVLKKAAEVFAGKKKPYKLPENIEQIEGDGRNVCISGVCGILSDAGFIPNDYYTNTSFVEKASELGFGSPQTDINNLKPGDVFQHLVDTNEQGKRYPTHAEIFKGWNDKGEAEFYDYYDFYNWPVSKSSGIRTYSKGELEERLYRKAKNEHSDIQAQFFSLAGGQDRVTKQFPYNLPENELKDYFEKTHEANTTFSAPAPTIDKNSPLYYSSGEDVRQGTREGLANMFNNKELDKQLKRELKITDQDLQKIKPLIYGVVGQESQFNNPRSTEGGLKYMFENMFSPKGKSLGPGQIKLKSITPSVRESFGITKGSDLQDLKNTYVGLADIISKSANITDKYVSQETHPDLVDKDRFERALYFLNSPGKVRRSDKQNYDRSMKSNSVLTNFSEKAMMDAVGRANETKLSMDPGSYPAKVLDRAKELNKTINFEDTSVLPEVVVTAKKKKEENGGWLSKYEQGGMVLKKQTNDNFGKKANPNDVDVSMGPGFVGLGYNTKGRNYSPAWGGQFAMGGSLPGAVGFTYARTQNPAPSNGKYAKKTKASAQNGKEMKYYQEGLDFKPKTISQNGLLMDRFKEEKNLPDATRLAPPIRPLTKKEQEENVKINKEYKKKNEEYNKAVIADRKSRRETKGDVNVPGSFNIAEKLRWFPNSPGGWGQVFDEYVNPAFAVGSLADALGESIAAKDPKAVAATLAMTAGLGALGFDPLGDAMKLQRFSRGTFNNLGYRPQVASFGDPFKGGDNYFGGIGNLDDAAVAQQQQALVSPRQSALPQSSQSSRVPYQFPTDEELLAMNLREAERYAPRASRLGRQRMATPDDMTSLNRSTALDPIEEYYQRNPRPVTQRMPDEEGLAVVRNQDDILRTIRNRIDARQSQQIIPAPPPEIRVPTQSRGYEITDTDLVDLISEDDLVDRSMYNTQPTSQPTLSAGPKFGEEDFKIGRANPGRGEVIDATGNKFTQDVVDYSPNERAGTYQITGPDGGFMQVNTRINPNDPDGYLNVTNMTFRSEDEKIASRQLQKIFSNLPDKVNMERISTSMYSQPITDAQVTRWANDKRLTESFKDMYPAGRIELRDVNLELLNSWHKDQYDAVFNNKTGELYGDYLTQLKRQFPKIQRTAKNLSEATGTPLPEPEMRIYDPIVGSQIKLTMDDLNSSFWKNRFDENPYLKNNIEIYAPKYKFKKNWKNGGQIVDPMGQWAHPGEVTTIPSNDITMKGVNYDVLGISNTGDKKLMKPGKNYKFDGDYVTEYPKGGWLDKYK